MLDFLVIRRRVTGKGAVEIFPDFVVGRTTDLMVRGGTFYALRDAETNSSSDHEYHVQP